MPNPVVIVHGWSDTSKSFRKLADFLSSQLATQVATIDLADWISLDDEVTYRDLRTAMQRAWTNHPGIKNRKNVDIVSHSTGALVVRDWMSHFYKPDEVPIRRHIMLAPANFGSQLAHKGRSWYGRAFKGWRTGFETGTNLLKGLELASSYVWDLAERDLLGSTRYYGTDLVQAAVFVGNTGYGGAAAITDEVGGDGTVRVSTANLRASRLDVDFSDDGDIVPRFRNPPQKCALGFCISDGDNHSSITFQSKNESKEYAPFDPRTADRIRRALTIRTADWESFIQELDASNEALIEKESEHNYFHGYQNTVVKIHDSVGNPVEDYMVEFHQGRSRGFNIFNIGALFQRDIIQDVHNFSSDPAQRSFYLDITTLEPHLDNDLILEIEAQPFQRGKKGVGYSKLPRITLDSSARKKFFQRHRTLLVDIRVPRILGKDVLKLTRHS